MGINHWWYGICICCVVTANTDNNFISEKPLRKSKKKSVLKEELASARKDLAYVYNKEIAEAAQAQNRNIEAIEAMIENTESVTRADLQHKISEIHKEVSDARLRIQQLQNVKK